MFLVELSSVGLFVISIMCTSKDSLNMHYFQTIETDDDITLSCLELVRALHV